MELGHYEVLFPYHQDETTNAYICRLSGQPDAYGRYCVIAVNLLQNLPSVLTLVAELKKNRYEDFVEEFYLPSLYCIVFSCAEGEPLWRKEPGLDEADRRIIARKVVEALIYKNTPEALAVGTLTPHGILIGPGHSVGFAYTLPHDAKRNDEEDTLHCLARLLAHILTPEPGEAFSQWLEKLKNGAFEHIFEAYARMPEPQDELLRENAAGSPEAEPELDNGGKFKLAAVVLLFAVLVMLAAAYASLSPRTQEGDEPQERGSIHTLGTIRLD